MKNTFAAKLDIFTQRLLTGELTYRTQGNFEKAAKEEFDYVPNEHKTHFMGTLFIVTYNEDVWGRVWHNEINGFSDGYFTDEIVIAKGTQVIGELALSFGSLYIIGEENGEHFSISIGSHVLNKGHWTITN